MIIPPSAARLLGTGPTSSIPIPTTTSVVQPDNPVIILTYVIPTIQPLYDTPSPYHTMSYSTGQSWRKIVCLGVFQQPMYQLYSNNYGQSVLLLFFCHVINLCLYSDNSLPFFLFLIHFQSSLYMSLLIQSFFILFPFSSCLLFPLFRLFHPGIKTMYIKEFFDIYGAI